MIIYNVTVNIDLSVHDEWMEWMRIEHIPEVMRTGFFTHNRMMRLLNEENNNGVTYAIQYSCNSLNDYETYRERFAPALQKKHAEKFKDKFVAFRTLLEVVE